MYLFNGICLTDNLVKNLHRQVESAITSLINNTIINISIYNISFAISETFTKFASE